MAQEAKAGDVGGGMKTKVNGELGGIAVEAFHPGNGIFELFGGGEVAFERSGDDPGAKWF